MPLEPLTLTEPLVEKLIRLYNAAERDLLTQMAERLKQGITEDGWQERQLLELQRYRRQAQQVLEKLRANRRPLVDEAVAAAANRGAAVAIGDLTPTIAGALSVQQVDTYAVLALAAELNMDLDAADNVILRAVDDMYRRVVASETSRVLLGTQTRQQAADQAFRRLAANGIHAFTDKAGRKWEMRSYLESATRGTLTNATIEGHTARLQDYGLDLVVVSDVPQECERCRFFEGKTLALRSSDQYVSLDEARARGLFHPGCVAGDTFVSPGGGIGVSDSRWYEGPVVVIKTALGDELTITPNHPVLTSHGWVPAGQLVVGTNVVRSSAEVERVHAVGPHEQDVPARISEIHGAFLDASEVVPMRVPTAAHDFHGDGGNSEVEIVTADCLLKDRVQVNQESGQPSLLVGGVRLPLLFGCGPSLDLDIGEYAARSGSVGGSSKRLTLCSAHAAEAASQGFTPGDRGVSVTSEAGTERRLGEADSSGSLFLGEFAGQVSESSIVELSSRDFAGHVYNLQCEDGWYAANSIVVHNCRHSIAAKTSRTRSFGATADPAGEKARQKLRYLERQVRAAKREQLAALDPAGAKAAGVKVRRYQARIREHVATHGINRQRHREQLNTGR